MIYALQVELSREQIKSIREKLAKQNSVFADKRYLDSLYLPSNIMGRQKQAEQLLTYIESIRQGFTVPLISVYGRSGSGKSTLVRFVCHNIGDVASFAFVNLRRSRTIFGSANLILAELGGSSLQSADGINKAVDKIGNKIEEILLAENKKLFFLVLDEYDSIFSDPRGRPSDFVYKILTLEESLREKGLWLCVVTISNNAMADYDLDDRIKSRIGSSEVFFPPYTKSDVEKILQDRAEKAFAIKVDEKVLEYCATKSSDDHGDARRALDLLRYSGECCNGTILTTSDVDKAIEQMQKDRVSTIVSSASYHLRAVMASLCKNVLQSGIGWVATSSVYEKYGKVLESDKPPLSYRRVCDLLVELENSGLVVSRTVSRGRQGYGKEYKLKVSPELVGPQLDKTWWEATIEEKKKSEALDDALKKLEGLAGHDRKRKSHDSIFGSF